MTKEWFPHDIGARNDSKVLALRRRHGARGVGIYFMLLEVAYEHGGSIMARDENEIGVLEFDLRETNLLEFLRELVTIGLLLESEAGVFSSERIAKELAVRSAKTEARKVAAHGRWNKPDANAMQMHSKCNANAMHDEKRVLCNAMSLHNITIQDNNNTRQEGGGGGNVATEPPRASAPPTPQAEPEPKKQKPNPHEGKKQYLNSVFLRPGEHEKLIERYGKERLSREWVDRGIELLDAYFATKSTKRGCKTKRDEYSDDYRILISWPLQRCVQEAATKANLARQRSYANAPPPSAGRPQNGGTVPVQRSGMSPVGQVIGKLIGDFERRKNGND